MALNQGSGIWPMFFFGFAAIFLITQMQGLRLKRWLRQAFYSSFLLLLLYVYLFLREPYQVNEVIRIPLIEYLALFVMYWIYLAGAWISSKFRALTSAGESAAN